jgi:hypothetical protein
LNRTAGLFLLSVASIGCSPPESTSIADGSPVLPSCSLGLSQDPYFGGLLRGDTEFDVSTHYALLLFAMQEPSLACGPGAGESYRVLYLERLAPEVKAIRISHDTTGTTITSVTITRRADGSWPVTSRVHKDLPDTDWDRFSNLVSRHDPWSLRSMPQYPQEGTGRTLDGNIWILEGRAAGRYRAVLRGEMEDPFLQVARALFAAAGAGLPIELTPDGG